MIRNNKNNNNNNLVLLVLVSISMMILISTSPSSSSFSFFCLAQQQVTATLLAAALNHAVENGMGKVTVKKLQQKDVDTLYNVAKSMYTTPREGSNDRLDSIAIFHSLADSPNNNNIDNGGGSSSNNNDDDNSHIPSMIQLGYAYSKENKPLAIKYFAEAGYKGKHQVSLFNAGRLFAEQHMAAESLEFFKAAILLSGDGTSGNSHNEMTKTSQEAYDILCEQLITIDLPTEEMARTFLYADMEFPSNDERDEREWKTIILQIQQHLETKEHVGGVAARINRYHINHRRKMSELQKSLLKRILRKLSIWEEEIEEAEEF